MSDIKEALKIAEELKNFAEGLEGKNEANLSREDLIAALDQLEELAKQTLSELDKL